MKASEVRELTSEELLEKLEDRGQELFNLKFQQATGQLDSTARLLQTRKDIASLLSTLRERELA